MHIAPGARRVMRAFLAALLVPWLVLGLTTHGARAQAVSLRAVVNGQPVPLQGDAIVQDGVVMTPYQGLSEPLGIRATWDPRDQVLRLMSPAGDEMQLRPNDPYATVNGERRPIPIPLVTVFGRVLIPAQWVFDTLGDITTYDAASRTLVINAQITGITWRDAGAALEVTVDATAPLHTQITALHSPERLVVDVRGAVPRAPQQAIDVHEGPLATVAITGSAAGTRIVFNLTGPVRYRLVSTDSTRRAVIALSTGAPLPAGPGPARPLVLGPQRITNVAYQHLDDGGRVLITSTLPLQMTQHILRDPDRVVLDIADAVFIPVKQTVDVNDGLVVQIRAAQFHKDPNVVRVVVQLARPAPFAVRAGADVTHTMVDLGAAAASAPGPALPGPSGPHGAVVVALDPGHGGSDPGAIGPDGVQEKDVVLAIASDLRALLAQQGIDTVMVRDGDVFVPLDDRAPIAQRGGATMFVSIHANASVDANANGTQTFYYTPQSVPLAQAVLDELSQAVNLAPRGVTRARFEVLVDNAQIPAILIETAFITNPREEQMLRDPAAQQVFAQGILRGIVRYLSAQQAAGVLRPSAPNSAP